MLSSTKRPTVGQHSRNLLLNSDEKFKKINYEVIDTNQLDLVTNLLLENRISKNNSTNRTPLYFKFLQTIVEFPWSTPYSFAAINWRPARESKSKRERALARVCAHSVVYIFSLGSILIWLQSLRVPFPLLLPSYYQHLKSRAHIPTAVLGNPISSLSDSVNRPYTWRSQHQVPSV